MGPGSKHTHLSAQHKWVVVLICLAAVVVALLLYLCAMWTAYSWAQVSSTSLGDIFNGFILVVAVAAAILALVQLRDATATATGTFLKDLYSQMFSDPDIRDAFYLVDHGRFTWDEAQRGSDEERKMDRLLAFANLVCRLRDAGSIRADDMGLFEYEFRRVYGNASVHSYLTDLKGPYRKAGVGTEPFISFVRHCEAQMWEGPPTNRLPGDKWSTGSEVNNLARVVAVAGAAGGARFASEAREAILRTPQFRARLGTASNDVSRYPIATLLGELVGKMRWADTGRPPREIVQALIPFAQWQYGTYAIERGLDGVGWEGARGLLGNAPHLADYTVEALWSVGLLRIAELDTEAEHEACAIRAAVREDDPARGLRECTSRTRHCVANLAAAWGVPGPPDTWDAHRTRLWENAVVMARARFESEVTQDAEPGESPFAVFTGLLTHVAEGRVWPLSHVRNAAFLERAGEARVFAETTPDPRRVVLEAGEAHVQFLSDPLEVLNIGNAFGTCLRLAREGDEEETRLALGWATNANIRVIAVIDASRMILARQTLGLCVTQPVGVLFGPVYPPDSSRDVQNAIAQFRDGFLRRIGLTQVTAPQQPDGVEMTCVGAYNGGWLATREGGQGSGSVV